MTAKFTRGLTVQYSYSNHRACSEIYDEESRWVASVMGRSEEKWQQSFPTPEEADANALLFAAAPDLYDMLQEALEENQRILTDGWWIRVRLALAKARGERT